MVDALLQERWDDVHPRGVDGDFAIRMAALESLDDMPPVIFPLQYLPLTNHRRLGPVSYRSWMIANGEAKPREGEEPFWIGRRSRSAPDRDGAVRAGRNARPFPGVAGGASRISATVCMDRAGGDRAAKLERLPGLVEQDLGAAQRAS